MALQLDARPPAAPTPRGIRPSRAGWLSRVDAKYSPYLYIAPFFVVFAIFGAWPLAYTFWVSLHDWDLLGSDPTFVGAENYTRLLVDGDFWHSVVNTLGIFVISTVPQLLAALWLANLLNRQLRMRTGWRMAVLVPNVTSTAAVAIVFGVLFGREFGMINWMLDLVGIDGIAWKSDRFASWVAISTMVDWRWTGYNALIYLAAMQAIPKDLYEAAAIDGASRIRQFWQITVPMLRPTIIFTVIISTIGGLQLFTEPVLFSIHTPNKMDGGPLHQFQTITMYMYDNAFYSDRYGYGATVAWALFVMIIVFSLINFLAVRRTGGTK